MSLLQNNGAWLYNSSQSLQKMSNSFMPDTGYLEGIGKELPWKDIPQYFQNFKTKAEIDMAVLQAKTAARKANITPKTVISTATDMPSVAQQITSGADASVNAVANNNVSANNRFRLGAAAKKYALPALGGVALIGAGTYAYNKLNQPQQANYSYMCS